MKSLPAIIVTALLCVCSYFWGEHEEAKRLDRINAAIHQETRHALDDVKTEVMRVDAEYNARVQKMQAQWEMEISPLIAVARSKCKEGKPAAACNAANNAILSAAFNLGQQAK
jgi:hypothetical protein